MPSPQCADCFTDSCPMWRKTIRGLTVCNVCHLKRVTVSESSSAKQKEKSKDIVRQSGRRSKPSCKAAGLGRGKYSDKLTKGSSLKSRKSLLKKKPLKSPTVTGAVVTSSSIHHQGLLYKSGDIVSVTDISGQRYYAQLRGFMQDLFLRKSAVITWLLPTVPNPRKFDPSVFLPGPDEDMPRPMECFEFISRAPSNLFKLKTSYPPYLRTRVDLASLLSTAEELLKPELQRNTETEEHTAISVKLETIEKLDPSQ